MFQAMFCFGTEKNGSRHGKLFDFCLSVKGVSVLSWEIDMARAIGVA
jgi:hypothetical protein